MRSARSWTTSSAGATAAQPVDRFESVRDFLGYLDLVEEELTRPDQEEIPDLLTAARGMVIDGWKVEQVLGKGSTARALLMAKDETRQVYKVALSDAGRTRLAHEAAQLNDIRDSHIVRLIAGPVRSAIARSWSSSGPVSRPWASTSAARAGSPSVTWRLSATSCSRRSATWRVRASGIATSSQTTWPSASCPRRAADWSSSTSPWPTPANRATEVGTQPYLDPFLGTDRRPEYDAAAERYAVAVTLA